jgi:hypothetical protein
VRWVACALWLSLATAASALTIAPYPYVQTSQYGRFYFKMVGSLLTVYKLENDGTATELWQTQMDYAYPGELLLPEGGEHLIRFLAWVHEQGPSKDDRVLIFYKHGSIVKTYASADLVTRHRQFIDSSDGFMLGRGKPEILGNYPVFPRIRIGIQDGGEYVFNYDTGEIVAAVKDSLP